MGRRRKQEPEPFHNPFLAARDALESAVAEVERQRRHRESEPSGERTRPVQAAREPTAEELFLREVADAEPLRDRDERVVGRRAAPARPSPTEEEEAVAALEALVSGRVAFEITDTAEYVEGIVQGLDRRLLHKLRKGAYSVQAHLDLHGLTRDEAKQEVTEFLLEARRYGLRCVLLVSGRGLHSPEGRPVLKTSLVEWLTGRKLGRHVLAFCSARPCDGGLGALYVLLRR